MGGTGKKKGEQKGGNEKFYFRISLFYYILCIRCIYLLCIYCFPIFTSQLPLNSPQQTHTKTPLHTHFFLFHPVCPSLYVLT